MDIETGNIAHDRLIKKSKDNAELARRGMVWNKWRWVWPQDVPEKHKRKFRFSAQKENRRKKAVGEVNGHRQCDCGNPATKKKNNAHICDRCDEIETRMGHMILKR